MSPVHQFTQQLHVDLQTFHGWARLIVSLCVASVLAAVAVNFSIARKAHAVARERPSFIRTGPMLAFFVIVYLLIRFQIGAKEIPGIYYPCAVAGLVLVILGTVFNVVGRFSLGRNWGNQVIIYKDHLLVTAGMYRIVRHPLYAGLIWMFIGASFVFQNWAALAATVFIFVPAMLYRAKLEERALIAQFPDYVIYRNKTGMFLPIPMGSEVAMVPEHAFAFCRIFLTVLLWLALWFANVWLVVAVLVILVLSLLLKVQRSPMVQLYQQTVLRLFPSERLVALDVPAMRFAHGTGAVMAFVVLLLIALFPKGGWYALGAFCLIKTISAFGFCPASKLFVCLRNGGCCALTRRGGC